MILSENKKFLGIGWEFPVRITSTRMISMSEYEENIKESIRIILETAKGERIMRPNFGCGIHDFVFETINASTLGQIESSVRDALEMWEPRIEIITVNTHPERESSTGKLLINIQYLVRKTNNQFNMVYPFYLTEGMG